MAQAVNGDLTVGSPGRKLLRFALPIIFINLLQAVYNVADMIIIGHWADAAAMAAVSTGGQVTTVILVVVTAIANGGTTLIGRSFSTGRTDSIKKLTGTMYSFVLVIALVLTVLGLVFSSELLRMLNIPDESYVSALWYLCICVAGTAAVYSYNVFYAVLRGIGESDTPLRIMLITTAENIFLDLLLVAVIPLGAAGAAAATVASQITSAALIGRRVCKLGYFSFKGRWFGIKKDVLGPLMRICTPQVLQMLLTNSSFMLIGGIVNIFGVDCAAAAGAVTKIWNFTVLSGQAMMAALITVSAQNCAKGSYGYVLKALYAGAALTAGIGAVFTLLCELCPGFMLGLFTDDAAVVEAGITYLRYFAIGFIAENIMFCLFGVLTGSGHTMVPFACATISAYLIRYLLAWVFSHLTPLGFNGIGIAYSIAPFVSALICAAYIASGRWKQQNIRM